jgi:PAT family beta-lactamase induction signal transducer AmpG
MLVSGAAALELAEHLPWRVVYLTLAGVMALASCATVFAPEPEREPTPPAETLSWNARITQPFLDFFLRAGAVEILLFVMIYKLSTMMATALTTPFLMELGFAKAEIGRVTKLFGLIATIAGTLAGGTLLDRIGLKRALWIFGLLQATAGLSFILINAVGYNLPLLTVVIFVENFMMGLGAAALQGFMMSICSRQFTGTQFALLSSITAVSRVVLVSQAGILVTHLGWTQYFILSALLAVPSLLILRRFDTWSAQKDPRPPTWRDKLQGACFVLGLLCIASEPIWSWLHYPLLASRISWIGASTIAVAIIGTFFLATPARKSGPEATFSKLT